MGLFTELLFVNNPGTYRHCYDNYFIFFNHYDNRHLVNAIDNIKTAPLDAKFAKRVLYTRVLLSVV